MLMFDGRWRKRRIEMSRNELGEVLLGHPERSGVFSHREGGTMLGLEGEFSFLYTTGSSEVKEGRSVAKKAREYLPAEMTNEVLIELRLESIQRFSNTIEGNHG